MTAFEQLPDNPDILAVSQEELVMLIVSLATGIERAKLHPDYWDFTYQHVSTNVVKATFTGRAHAKDGRRGIWSGSKTIELTRARLNRGTSPIQLVVAYRPGMTMEHILRALEVTYEMKVTAPELLLKNSVGNFEPFNIALRPPAMTLDLRFSTTQARIAPIGSEFSIRLDNSGRPDINDYLHVIKAGSITGGL